MSVSFYLTTFYALGFPNIYNYCHIYIAVCGKIQNLCVARSYLCLVIAFLMSKIHPAENRRLTDGAAAIADGSGGGGGEEDKACYSLSIFTVWKRSSMSFQGTDGFTVYDDNGRLSFRVDNYSRMNQYFCGRSGLVLMDGAGKALLTLKPQMFSMNCQWNAYRGDEGRGRSLNSLVFTMRKKTGIIDGRKSEAEIFMGEGHANQAPDFWIEGSFRMRNCRIRIPTGEVVAQMARKQANSKILLGEDVFSLVVQSGFDAEIVMAFVIILDRICERTFAPVMCS